MRAGSKLGWVLAAESGVLLVLPFPLAGPLPHWRAALAWIAFIPLLIALLVPRDGFRMAARGANTLLGYFCGVLWYGGTCYWIESTMRLYGNLSPFDGQHRACAVLFISWPLLRVVCISRTVSQSAIGNTVWTFMLIPRVMGLRWNLRCATSQAFPGTSSAIPRWTICC